MTSAQVKVTVVNINLEKDSCIYHGSGVYFGNGRLVFTAKAPEGTLNLEIDPECFNEEDPKRCICGDKWSKYRIRSIIINQIRGKMRKTGYLAVQG
jgi:hypothetical protein